MRTVSFQGIQLTAGQRRQQQFQQQVRANFLSSSLQQIVDDSLAEIAKRKCDGVKPERIWSVDRIEKGTPWLGDVFGY